MGAVMPTAFDETGRPVLIVYNEQGEPIRADAKAPANARLAAAREQMVGQATAGAQARSEAAPARTPASAMFRRSEMGEDLTRQPDPASMLVPLSAVSLAGAGAVPAVKGVAKAVLPYAAAEVAEKTLGLPKWIGEAVGAVGPGRALLKGLTTRVVDRVASEVAAKGGAKATEKLIEKRLAQEAEKLALKRESIELAKRRLALAESRSGGRVAAGTRAQVASATAGQPVGVSASSVPASVATPTRAAGPVMVPATTGIPVAAAPNETIILKLQQEMKTVAGRKVVRDYLNTLPKDKASELRLALARGQAHPATVAPGGVRSASKMPSARERGLGAELARMLGQ